MLRKLTYLLLFVSMLAIASTIGIVLIDTNENNKVFAQQQQQTSNDTNLVLKQDH